MIVNSKMLCHINVSPIQYRRISSLSSYVNEKQKQLGFHKKDPDMDIYRQGIKVPTIHKYHKQSAAMFVQKVEGTNLAIKYGNDFNQYPTDLKQKIKNLQFIAMQCNLDLTKLSAHDLLIDKSDRLWIVGFQNLERIEYL